MTRTPRYPVQTMVSISLMLLLLVSCLGSGKRGIIPEKKFVNVLVDLHLADAIASERMSIVQTYALDSATLYGSVFVKHGVTKAMFDSTLAYYSRHPDDFQKVYNTVTARLKRMEEAVAAEEDAARMREEEAIWIDSQIHSFPPLTYSRVEINVPVKGPGLYTVSATMKIYPDDSSLNPRMSIYFYGDNNTPEGLRDNFAENIYETRDGTTETYTTQKMLTDTTISHIKGFIVNYSNTDTLFRRHMEVTEIKITRKKSVDTLPR